MKRSTLTRAAIPVAVVLSFGLAACGDDGDAVDDVDVDPGATTEELTGETTDAAPAGEELSGTISGAGASSQQAGVQAWIASYNSVQPGVTVNYDPIGSGGGRDAFTGGAVDYAGSDAVLDEEERAAAAEVCGGEDGAIHLPLYISPIAVVFNLEGVDDLNLSAPTIAGIFAEEITTWNDPAIVADNPDVELPDLAIVPVHRADESGTTENFVDYLAQTAPDVWTYEVEGNWPSDLTGEAAPQTAGVVSAVQAGDGYIGYADASQAGDLGTAAVGLDGEFIEYSPEAASALVENSPEIEGGSEFDLAFELDRTAAGAYPIGLVSYHIACLDYEDDEKAALVKDYLSYIASEEGQQAAADNAGSAPIGEGLREQVMTSIEAIQ